MTAKIIQSKRQIIENQLLTALDDKSKVALIFNEKDLDLLIAVLAAYQKIDNKANKPNSQTTSMLNDIQLLKDSAFPSGENQLTLSGNSNSRLLSFKRFQSLAIANC